MNLQQRLQRETCILENGPQRGNDMYIHRIIYHESQIME